MEKATQIEFGGCVMHKGLDDQRAMQGDPANSFVMHKGETLDEYNARLNSARRLADHVVKQLSDRDVMKISSLLDMTIEFQDFFFNAVEQRMRSMGF